MVKLCGITGEMVSARAEDIHHAQLGVTLPTFVIHEVEQAQRMPHVMTITIRISDGSPDAAPCHTIFNGLPYEYMGYQTDGDLVRLYFRQIFEGEIE